MSVPAVLTSRVGEAITALAAQLAARPGLAGVPIFEEPMGTDPLPLEQIIVAYEVPGRQEFRSLGNRAVEENFTLRGMVEVYWPEQTSEGIRAARERVFVLFAEVADELRRRDQSISLGGVVREAKLTSYRWASTATTERRHNQILFDIDCYAFLT
jgi:hypothetical protein